VPKLWYHLHTFLEKHSTSDFLIGTALNVLHIWSQIEWKPLFNCLYFVVEIEY